MELDITQFHAGESLYMPRQVYVLDQIDNMLSTIHYWYSARPSKDFTENQYWYFLQLATIKELELDRCLSKDLYDKCTSY